MRKAIFGSLLAVALCGCSANSGMPYTHIEGFAQGTTYSITYRDSVDYKQQIETLLLDFDHSLSVFDSTSNLLALNENRTDSVDAWFTECFAISKGVYEASGHLFDPTLRPLIAAYGFGRKTEQKELDHKQFTEIMSSVGFDKIRIENGRLIKDNPQTQLDFNAIAQGYSVDLVARLFDSLGVNHYMIEIGGEIFVRGVAPSGNKWRIGIDTPEEGNFTPGASISVVVELTDRALATSGNYRKFIDTPSGERITHTIDPRTGLPAHHNLLSATILAPTAALADGYATACMVGGLEWAQKFIAANPEVDGYLIYTDKKGAMQTFSTVK